MMKKVDEFVHLLSFLSKFEGEGKARFNEKVVLYIKGQILANTILQLEGKGVYL